jgi:hypothetical protein
MPDDMQKQGLTEGESFQDALEEMLKHGAPPEDEPGGQSELED